MEKKNPAQRAGEKIILLRFCLKKISWLGPKTQAPPPLPWISNGPCLMGVRIKYRLLEQSSDNFDFFVRCADIFEEGSSRVFWSIFPLEICACCGTNLYSSKKVLHHSLLLHQIPVNPPPPPVDGCQVENVSSVSPATKWGGFSE